MEAWNIKKIREDLKWTQEQFARRLKVSFSTVSRWEHGKTNLSPLAGVQLKRMAKKEGLNLNKYLRRRLRH